MIQINTTLTTPDGGTLASGAVIDVTPCFRSRIVDIVEVIDDVPTVTGQEVKHDCMFDVQVFRSMAAYEAKTQRVKSTFIEFNTGYVEFDIDIVALNAAIGSLDTMFAWLQTHIENGDSKYTGVGVSNTAVVYPFV